MLSLFFLACTPAPGARDLPVRWVRSRDESFEQADAGFRWGLASVGAAPLGAVLRDVRGDGDLRTATLDLDAAGFAEGALPAVDAALAPLRDSDEIERLGGVDLGRVAMRLFYDPWSYYALTGACASFGDWDARFGVDAPGVFAATSSSVAYAERRVDYPTEAGAVSDLRFVAWGGTGSLVDGTFVEAAPETLQALPTGQIRFASYDEDGQLVPVSDPTSSVAGQPGTCQWCHEGHLQPAFVDTVPAPGTLDADAWNALVPGWNALLAARQSAVTGVEWDVATHSWLEHLAEDFAEPSVERLAREWGDDVDTTAARVEAVLRAGESGSSIAPRAEVDRIYGLAAPSVQPWPRSYDAVVGTATRDAMLPFVDCRDPFDD